jgi:hypothetical protein
MADSFGVLSRLVDREDVRRWAAVNKVEIEEKGDNAILVGEYTVVLDEYGKVFFVERRAEHDEPTPL